MGSASCWVDVYELSQFRGRHRRLFGPAVFAAVRSRLPEWGVAIDSLRVGPGTFVRLFRADDPAATSLWLLPGQVVEDVANLSARDDLDSLDLRERAPACDEPGYARCAEALARAAQAKTHG